ncbi:putative NOT transcription complex subunit VIP2 [Tasmannia lanceolata]|uniref:putative NOT transcription complex subunit VIP2 n=1 Tax=Tasmannia lanceolata TaxID=3420 RepID=UPI004063912A
MSGFLNSNLTGSTSDVPNSAGQTFATSFSAQSGSVPVFHHSGAVQGPHNIHGSFNFSNMQGSLTSRSAAMAGVPSNGLQQYAGSLSSGRFASNNLPVVLSQISHGSSHGHSGITNRGGISVVGGPAFSGSMNGSIQGIPRTSAIVGNRNAIPGLGVSPILGNAGPWITSSMGDIIGGGNIGRSLSSVGTSRINLTVNNGSGNLSVQGPSRLMSGAPQQAPSMLGNSYLTSGGPFSQSQVQAGNNLLSSIGILNDVYSNDNSPFDMTDFPQLTGHPNSAGGPQGQLDSLRKQGVNLSSIVQPSQDVNFQNEDFPALPGFKGGNSDFAMDMHQKEQFHGNAGSMMQSHHFPMGRSAGFSLGDTYPSHGAYHLQAQSSGPPSIGMRPLNSPNSVSGMGSYDHLIPQYQHHQNQPQFRLQQMSAVTKSYREPSLKSIQGSQTSPDRFGLLGLLNVIGGTNNPDATTLALGIDLTTLGLNLNSTDNLHKTFGSPWSDKPSKGEPEFILPKCYYANQPPPLHPGYFSKFRLDTLFYIFYSMPKDEAQLYAANELHQRGWFYHREFRLWFIRVQNMEPLVKTNTFERGSYHCFDPNTWKTVRMDNFVVQYEMLEKRPSLPHH